MEIWGPNMLAAEASTFLLPYSLIEVTQANGSLTEAEKEDSMQHAAVTVRGFGCCSPLRCSVVQPSGPLAAHLPPSLILGRQKYLPGK